MSATRAAAEAQIRITGHIREVRGGMLWVDGVDEGLGEQREGQEHWGQ